MTVHLVVVAFDPGVSTGWAIVRVPVKILLERGQVGSTSQMKVTCGQFRTGSTGGNVGRALDLMRLAYEEVAEEGDLLVCVQEGFTLRMLSKDPEMLEPVRWLAIWDEVERLRKLALAVPFPFAVERQDPSLATSVMTDSRLRLWGLWFNAKEHGRAALKHALMYLRRFTTDSSLRERAGWEGDSAKTADPEADPGTSGRRPGAAVPDPGERPGPTGRRNGAPRRVGASGGAQGRRATAQRR